MNRSVTQATIALERAFEAPVGRVYGAWTTAETKKPWFFCEDGWPTEAYALDFRVGGRETNAVRPPGGELHRFEAIYQDIVPEERILYAYEMFVGATRISVSLVTLQFRPDGDGTRLLFAEQGVFLDAAHTPSEREEGMRVGFDNLARYLRAN